MRGRFRVPLFVVALALLGLIGLLATLQYRWLGRVSEAERDRMRASLASGASAFAQDFDGELTRAYLLFQATPGSEDEDLAVRFSSRYDRWQATSKFPRLIKAVYAFSPGEGELKRLDVHARAFVPAEWPPSMAAWRAHLVDSTSVRTETRGNGDTLMIRRMAPPVWATAPALVVPSPILVAGGPGSFPARMAPRFTYAILEIDEACAAREVLPALAEQHFARGSGEYQIAVVSRAAGGRVIYRSTDEFNPSPDAPVDAATDLFSVRTQEFSRMASEVHRFTTYASRLGARGDGARQGETASARGPVAIVIEQAGGSGGPMNALADALVAPAGRVATAPSWQLLLKHESGSLETAVNAARRRNMTVSSSILGVLGASMVLLVLATRRAQRLARQQMEFVATVSHELRTPLAVIRSAAENLADGIVADGEQVKRYGEVMRGEGRRLTHMVEQILAFSGLQSGERRLEAVPVAIPPLIRDVLAASTPLPDLDPVQVEVSLEDDLPPVLGDEPALRRALENLLANAAKYGAGGGWIGVTAGRRGAEVAITVSDRGMGIAAAEQARIFEPFYRAPAVVAARIQGAGLGLSLVQRIVGAHGGRVTVRSAPGEGAAFTVHLPAAGAARARRPSGAGAEAPRYS